MLTVVMVSLDGSVIDVLSCSHGLDI